MYRFIAGLIVTVLVAVPTASAWSTCQVHVFRCDQCFFSGTAAKKCSVAPSGSSAEFKFDSVSSFSCQLEGANGCSGQVDCAGTDKCEKVHMFADGQCAGAYMAQQNTVCCDACTF